MKPVVFLPEGLQPAGVALLEQHCDCIIPPKGRHQEHWSSLYESDGVILRGACVTADDLAKTDRLKVIAKHGAGTDNIDIPAATAKGIPVVYTPTAPTVPVAEFTLGLMISLGRNLGAADATVREGRFTERLGLMGIEFDGKTLGVIGLGEIGRRVARNAAGGLNMRVFGYDPYVSAETYDGPAVIEDSLEALLAQSDVVTLHVPLTKATHHLINEESLRHMKPTALIINTSRGSVIDETALVPALAEGRLGGAALDVFEQEPLPADSPLCRLPNVVLAPHIASATPEAMDRMSVGAAQGVLDVLQGREPEYVVNREGLK